MRNRKTMTLETLEARDVPAVLDISPAGALTFTDGTAQPNALTVSLTSGVYTFADSQAVITLGDGAVAAGWRGSGTGTVTGPASAVASLGIAPGGGTNSVNVRSAADPITVSGDPSESSLAVTLGSSAPSPSGTVAGILAPASVAAGGNTSLVVADATAASRAGTVGVEAHAVTGLLPGGNAVTWSGTLASLRVLGSNSSTLAESYDVASPDAAYFRLDCLGGSDTVTVSADTVGDIYLGGGDDTLTVLGGVTLSGNVHTGGQAGDEVWANLDGYGTVTGTIGN